MFLAVALSLSIGAIPHRELPSTFVAGRLFVMPRVANSNRRLGLSVDTHGSGFIRSTVVSQLHLQTADQHVAYLPAFSETAFPAVTANYGALPILDDAQIARDPVFSGVDGQLGWPWLVNRIWTIDYIGRHFYQDYSAPPVPDSERVPLLFDSDHRYPQLMIEIGSNAYRTALDTAASLAVRDALASGTYTAVHVEAMSFVPFATMMAWHTAHPDWLYGPINGLPSDVVMIRVPEATAGGVIFHDVSFWARPRDGMFKGESVDLILGPNAFENCALTLDYVHDFAGFEC